MCPVNLSTTSQCVWLKLPFPFSYIWIVFSLFFWASPATQRQKYIEWCPGRQQTSQDDSGLSSKHCFTGFTQTTGRDSPDAFPPTQPVREQVSNNQSVESLHTCSLSLSSDLFTQQIQSGMRSYPVWMNSTRVPKTLPPPFFLSLCSPLVRGDKEIQLHRAHL